MALQAMCILWLPWKAQQIHGIYCSTNNDNKIKSFPLNQNLTSTNYTTVCDDLCDMPSGVC